MTNQLSWYVLITHLKTYNLILSGSDYRECKSKIRRTEIISFVIVIVLSILYLISIIAYDVLIRIITAEELLQEILQYEVVSFYFILVISELLIYFKLIKAMKQNLHFHYMKNKNRFLIIMFWNVFYFIIQISAIMSTIILGGERNWLKGFSHTKYCSGVERIMYLFVLIH